MRGAEYAPGTIVIKTNERRLYLILDDGHAMRYPVGVGKYGKQSAGVTSIEGKYSNSAWLPGGSPKNPMGVAAMTLAGGEYAIHGTNTRLGRRLRLLRLHPHAQRRHH